MMTLIFQIVGYTILSFAVMAFFVLIFALCYAGKSAEIMEGVIDETHEEL